MTDEIFILLTLQQYSVMLYPLCIIFTAARSMAGFDTGHQIRDAATFLLNQDDVAGQV